MFQCQLLNECQYDLVVQAEKGMFLWCVYVRACMRAYACVHVLNVAHLYMMDVHHFYTSAF